MNTGSLTAGAIANLIAENAALKEENEWLKSCIAEMEGVPDQLTAIALEDKAIKILGLLSDAYGNLDYRSSTINYARVLKGRQTIRRINANRNSEKSANEGGGM